MAPENPSYTEVIDKAVEDKALSKQEIQKISDLYKKAQTLEEKDKIKEHLDSLVRNETIQGLNELKKEIWNIDSNEYLGINNENLTDLEEQYNINIEKTDEGMFVVKDSEGKYVGTFNNTDEIITNFSKTEKSQETIETSTEDIKNGLKSVLEGYIDGKLGNIDASRKEKLIDDLMQDLDNLKLFEDLSQLGGQIDFSKINTPEEFVNSLKDKISNFKVIINVFQEFNKKILDLGNLGNLNKIHLLKDVDLTAEDKQQMEKDVKDLIEDKNESKDAKVKKAQSKINEALNSNTDTNSSSSLEDRLNKMFPGNDFFSKIMKFFILLLNGGNLGSEQAKGKKSISNLAKYAESSESPLKGKIKAEDLKKLDPKKLKKFYQYLKDKGIDPNQNKFWEKVLTGKGTKSGDKLHTLHSQLVDSKGKILGPKQGLNDFVSKLNALGKSSDKSTDKQTSAPKKTTSTSQKTSTKTKKTT